VGIGKRAAAILMENKKSLQIRKKIWMNAYEKVDEK